MSSTNTKNGFTLIELLVVISIIGFMSSIVISTVNTARIKAEDSNTTQAVKQFKIAMELSRDENGVYPSAFPPGDIRNIENSYCIGENPNDGDNVCGHNGSQTENVNINNSISVYLQTFPIIQEIDVGPGTFEGISYSCDDATCQTITIMWPIKNTNSSCPGGKTAMEFGLNFGIPPGQVCILDLQ